MAGAIGTDCSDCLLRVMRHYEPWDNAAQMQLWESKGELWVWFNYMDWTGGTAISMMLLLLLAFLILAGMVCVKGLNPCPRTPPEDRITWEVVATLWKTLQEDAESVPSNASVPGEDETAFEYEDTDVQSIDEKQSVMMRTFHVLTGNLFDPKSGGILSQALAKEGFLTHHLEKLGKKAAESFPLQRALQRAMPVIRKRLPKALRPEVEPLMAKLNSIDKVRAALKDIDRFVLEFAVERALEKVKPMLESHLPIVLTWADVEPLWGEVCTLSKMEEALEDPETFVQKLLDKALRLALESGKPLAVLIESALRALPIKVKYSDLEPELLKLTTAQIWEAIDNPEILLMSMVNLAAEKA
eukprot:6990723-Prymnesium_polylepis.1